MPRQDTTEQRILRAATQVFMERGKEGARMQAIAERAGVNKALLHYYFRSKEKLYRRIISDLVEEVVDSVLLSIPRQVSFREFLTTFISSYIDHLAANPALIRFVLWEIGGSWETPEQTATIGTIFREAIAKHAGEHHLLLETVRKAIERGEIRSVDALQFVLTLLAVCVYPFVARPLLQAAFPQLDVLSESFLNQRKRELVDLFWNGLKVNSSEPVSAEET